MQSASYVAVSPLGTDLIFVLKRKVADEMLEIQEDEGTKDGCELSSHRVCSPELRPTAFFHKPASALVDPPCLMGLDQPSGPWNGRPASDLEEVEKKHRGDRRHRECVLCHLF